MKKLFLVLLSLSLVQANTPDPDSYGDATLTKAERDFAIAYLKDSEAYFQKAVKGLSEAQLQYKAAPDRWSIAQCMEHIAKSEGGIFSGIEKMLKDPADPSKRSEIKVTDQGLLDATVDRSKKFNAPEFLKPGGETDPKSNEKSFLENRDKLIKWMGTTEDDLRNHTMPHPAFGPLDGYQWVLLIGSHGKRHTLQIEEVKGDAGFPRK